MTVDQATVAAPRTHSDNRAVPNRRRVAYAQRSLEEMAAEAARSSYSGTIGIEIPVKDGRLGRVKRLSIVFEPE